MNGTWLDFEKPIVDLERRIEDLRASAPENAEIEEELSRLEKKADKLRRDVYSKLTRWQRVKLARHPRRPYTLDYLKVLAPGFMELHGDRRFGDDPAIISGLMTIEDLPLVLIGHQKGRDTKENIHRNFGMANPEGYRKALRLMQLAAKLGCPLVTFVDTPGAYPGLGAEERGQSEAIARNLVEMAHLPVPIVSVVIGEVHPLSVAGRMFTVLLIFCGVGTAFYTVTLLATIIVEGGLHQRFEKRRAARMLEQIKDHFILCGYGRIGSIIAGELHQQGVPLAVVERDPQRVRQAIERGWLALEADASREEVLAKAGIHRARGLIAAVGTDAENVFTVLTARVMRPDLFIIARVESDDAEHKLRRAGADRVISPYQIGANHMVQTALRPAVVDFVHLATSSERLDLSMEQVHIREDSALANQSIVDAGIRQRFGVIVVGIKRAGGAMEFNPPPEAIMRAGDELVVLGRTDSVKALEKEKGVVA